MCTVTTVRKSFLVEQDEALKTGINLGNPEARRQQRDYGTIKDLGKAVKGTAGKLTTIDGLRDLGKDTGNMGKKVLAAPLKVRNSGLATPTVQKFCEPIIF